MTKYRSEITASEEFNLFCYWSQIGNKWADIAKIMGRAENWVKNNWKRILRREKITDIQKELAQLMEKLKENAMSEELLIPPFCREENEKIEELHNIMPFEEIKEDQGFPILAMDVGSRIHLSSEHNSGEIMNIAIDTESDNFDFADYTNERRAELMEFDFPDTNRYRMENYAKNPF